MSLQLSFQEEPSDEYFPELQDLPSSVMYMDLKVIGRHRVTCLGCQTGYCQCSIVDLSTNSEFVGRQHDDVTVTCHSEFYVAS